MQGRKSAVGTLSSGSQLYWNPYQQAFLQALALRTKSGRRAFDRLALFAGRRGGKTKIGAIAATQQMRVANTYGWVCAPTYPDLTDYVLPEVLGLVPQQWVADWSQSRLELKLINGARVAFRSLDDPEKARGPGLDWAWIDEARKIQQMAWQVMSPALSDRAGVAWFTTTPNGFDWCYKELWRRAQEEEPGFWATRYWTEENPIYRQPAQRAALERDRRTMDPTFFAQEYQADFVTFTGAIYGSAINQQVLRNDDPRLKRLFPEWPKISPARPCYVGLDPGADHPFAAVVLVSTEAGLVVVGEYLQRNKSAYEHKRGILQVLAKWNAERPFSPEQWAIDRSQRQMAIELAQAPYPIISTAAENDIRAGINRVRGWLETGRLWVLGESCPRLVEQMRGYRWDENIAPNGEYRREQPRKEDDDLPDALRYALMLSPEIPETIVDEQLRPGLETFTEEQLWAVSRNDRVNRRMRGDFSDEDMPEDTTTNVSVTRAYHDEREGEAEGLGDMFQ